MKKMLLSLIGLISFSVVIFAQCDDLFISEYVNGFGNNRAIELYNPTPNAIDLGEYQVGRFRNGQVTWFGHVLPAGEMIAPYETYVIVSDKRVANTTFNNFEHPVWDGFLVLVPAVDELTNEPFLDDDGNPILVVEFETVGSDVFPVFGDDYNEEYDLKGKADIFICPSYDENKTFYFNGNDATVLAKGENPPDSYAPMDEIGLFMDDYNNLIDVVGVIGQDPEEAFGTEGWPDPSDLWYTVNKTIVRKPSFRQGQVLAVGSDNFEVNFDTDGEAFNYETFDVYPKDTFSMLGWHESECDPNFIAGIDNADFNSSMFPNPLSDGDLTIVSEEFISEILIYNMNGQKVRTIRVPGSANQLKMKLGKMLPGIYSVHLVFENGQHGVEKLSIR